MNPSTVAFSPLPGGDPGAWEATVKLIRQANHILLICHVAPDGDAIGSLLGLGLGLEFLSKSSTRACESQPPAKFGFLRGFETITSAPDHDACDLVISLDSSDPGRMGNVYDPDRLAGIPLINLDHHVTNLDFGDINLVDTSAASTAEVVLNLLDHLGIPIGPHPDALFADIATCLLTGIVTDTVGFRTANVTPQVMQATVRLMQAGASLAQVTHWSFNQRPLAELSLLARGLGRLQAQDGLAWSEITLADRRAVGLDNTDSAKRAANGDAGLVGMLARTREVHIAAVFVEKEHNRVEISFRADPGFDVSQLALSLGGGGHPAASGCTIDGSLEAVKARVLPLLRATLQAQTESRPSKIEHWTAS
jgi:phosphoesterase RecJ-like protein